MANYIRPDLTAYTVGMTSIEQLASKLRRGASRLEASELTMIKNREAHHADIVEAARAGMPQHQIVELTGYGRERVRIICREGGVEPARKGRPAGERNRGRTNADPRAGASKRREVLERAS